MLNCRTSDSLFNWALVCWENLLTNKCEPIKIKKTRELGNRESLIKWKIFDKMGNLKIIGSCIILNNIIYNDDIGFGITMFIIQT